MKMLANLVSGETSLPNLQTASYLCPHMAFPLCKDWRRDLVSVLLLIRTSDLTD